jgi:ubiquinone/menaquinone biosynthesis C-methylase UbiE
MYFAQTAFTSFVKSELIRSLEGSKWVLDLASGKGQDLGRYRTANITNVIFSDKDETALMTLIDRNYQMMKTAENKMRVYTIPVDLTISTKEFATKVNEITSGFALDAIVCNLAIHYFCRTPTEITNLISLISVLLKKEGKFIFTCMNGQAVFDKVKDTPFHVTSDDKVKYHIEKAFLDDTFTASGQGIKIKVPFSDTLYEENLVNIEYIIKQFTKNKFECISNESFEGYLPMFSQVNNKVYQQLNSSDTEFVSLYSYVVLKKV